MPGFKINGQGTGPDGSPSIELLKDHRFTLTEFLGMDGTQDPFIQLKEVTLPEKVVETLEIKCPGTTYKFAKSVNYTDLVLSFYGTSGLIDKIEELENKVHTVDSGIGDFNTYLGDVTLNFTDGEGSPLSILLFSNCFLSNTKFGDVSYGSSEIKLITLTLKCNYYTITQAS